MNRLDSWLRTFGAVSDAPPAAQHDTIIDDLKERGREERYRRKASDANTALRQALKQIDVLEQTIAAYETYTQEPFRRIEPARLNPERRPAAAVALLSDIHGEERVVRSDAIPNEYNLVIAEHRVSRFFAAIAWLVSNAMAFDIDPIVIWLGGDLISGDIHDELLETAECPPGEAALLVRDWITSGIRHVLDTHPTKSILIPCSIGNHGRTTKRMRKTTAYGHSWEWFLYQLIGQDFRDDDRVQVHATKDDMQYVDVLDFKLAFHHGHNIRYQGGLGGITVPAIKAVYRWEQWRDCDYYHFGHFHQRFDLGQIAFNGSVIGPNAYALSIGATPRRPEQSIYVLDAKRGKTMACPIWVEE